MAKLEDDLRATAAAGRELGGDYEPAVVHAFLERLDRELDVRVEARLDARAPAGVDWTTLLLVLGSIALALGVPGATHDKFGTVATFVLTLIAWVAIAAINLAHFRSRRR